MLDHGQDIVAGVVLLAFVLVGRAAVVLSVSLIIIYAACVTVFFLRDCRVCFLAPVVLLAFQGVDFDVKMDAKWRQKVSDYLVRIFTDEGVVVLEPLLEGEVVRAYLVFDQLQLELLLSLLCFLLESCVDPGDDVADAYCTQVAVREAVLDFATIVVVRVRVIDVRGLFD